MKKLLMTLLLTCTSLFGTSGMAQTMAPTNDELYKAFGEKNGISQLMDDFVNRVVQDPRIGVQFKDTKLPGLKAKLTDQVCQLTGGPCSYKGADMKSAHAAMDISKGDFNALVENLQSAMEALGIPFTQQNRLLALLAPMHRDVITLH
jgi:hemoglobin